MFISGEVPAEVEDQTREVLEEQERPDITSQKQGSQYHHQMWARHYKLPSVVVERVDLLEAEHRAEPTARA
jgi:hypothetical protein